MSAVPTPVKSIQADVPSLGKLLVATGIALLVAAVILVTIVLPAEYGIDPLGTGRALGLGELARATGQPAAAPQAAAADGAPSTSINPVLVPSPTGDAPAVRNAFIAQPGRFHLDSREITLAAGEGMEIKYNMKKGAGLLYSWTADSALAFEFHGDPDVKPAGREGTDYYETYELNDKTGSTEQSGTFLAPSTGIHGWFWENKTSAPVKLKLVSAGFYDWISENRKDKQTALKPMDPYELPAHPKVPDEVLK